MSNIPVFNFPVLANDTGEKEYLVRTVKFGDGYEQTTGEGLNDSKSSWSISFVGVTEKVNEVINFLDERKGYRSFLWKDPLGRTMLFRAKKWQITPMATDVFKITTIFEQSFAP